MVLPIDGVSTGIIIGIILVALWSLIWKGIGLYKSAKRGHMIWFVFILIFNINMGILPIIYLLLNRGKD